MPLCVFFNQSSMTIIKMLFKKKNYLRNHYTKLHYFEMLQEACKKYTALTAKNCHK